MDTHDGTFGGEQLLDKEFDQYRLCCGSLCEAELVGGQVILNCLVCGTRWAEKSDGTLAPLPPNKAQIRNKPGDNGCNAD